MKSLTRDMLRNFVRKVIKEEQMKKISTLSEIPFAGDSKNYDKPVEIDFTGWNDPTPEFKHQQKVKKALSSFRRWFRSLDTQVRYSLETELKKSICKDLSLNELNDIMSKLQASMKGWNAPEDKNKKPK